MIQGNLAANAITIAGIDLDFTKTPNHIRVRGALVNSNNGQTLAVTDWIVGPWKKDTLDCLRDLCNLFERDMADRFMDSSTGGTSTGLKSSPDVGGLGEYIKDETPSV